MEHRTGIPALAEIAPRNHEFPLVEQWMKNLDEVNPVRQEVIAAIDNDDTTQIEEMGFPSDLLPIMKLWRESGPDILTSFSHPEEVDFYKIVGVFNLQLFREAAQTRGIDLPRVSVIYYDTIPLHRSALKPMQIGKYGLDMDMFGLRNKRGETLLTIPTTLPADAIVKAGEEFVLSGRKIENEFMELIKPGMYTEAKQRNLQMNKKEIAEVVKDAYQDRMKTMRTVLANARYDAGIPVEVSQFLMNFEQQLTGEILETGGVSLEDRLGIHNKLLSKDEAFLNLVRTSVLMLVTSRGTSVVTDSIRPWDGLGIVRLPNDEKKMLTKNEKDELVLLDRNDWAEKIPEGEFGNVLSHTIPLGRLETLAIIAGGVTLHMGSEHGIREKNIQTLGITGKGADYLSQLRIGEDKEQGNDGIVLNKDGNSYMPLPLMYLLLGRTGIKKLLREVVGKTPEPLIFNGTELQKFLGIHSLDEAVAHINSSPSEVYGTHV